MDTLEQIRDEFLVCQICHRHYVDPKLLPCLHTFCLKCLETFVHKSRNGDLISNGDITEQNEEDERSVVFNCPTCKTDTTLELSEDLQKIESGFSDNHLISSLIEKMEMHKAEQICESCSTKGQGLKSAKAEVWCQNCKVSFCDACIKAHNVIKACRDHVVMSLKDIQVNPIQSLQNTKREISCSEHKDKLLEFYCLDCRVAICSNCVAIYHRRCDMVETCADSAQKLKPETENVLKDLDSQGISLTDWQKDHLKEIEELEENKKSLVKEIKTVRKNVDYQLAKLEQSALEELDVKHTNALMEVKDRLNEIEGLKKNLENTNRFLKHLVEFGSDSEFLSVFDKVKNQIIEMNTNINRRKIAKLLFRHKFALDATLGRVYDLKSLGKIVDVVDMNKDSFPMNGDNGIGPLSPVRKSSIKRTGTFRVEKTEEEQNEQQSKQRPKSSKHQIQLQPIPAQSKSSSRSSLSTASPSTSNDSMSSSEMLETTPRRHAVSVRARAQQETCARLSAGSTGSLPRTKRVNSSIEFRKTQAMTSTPQKSSKTPPIQRRSQSTVNGRPPTSDKPPVRPERRSKTPDHSTRVPLTKRTNANGTDGILSPPLARRSEITPPKSPQQPRPQPIMDKTNAQLLCSFNGRTESDNKKCWPLDVTVLCDGTPVITDFHNKKIKAFDASGMVMCDVLLPSWPHGIANVEKSDVAVTLPEISTLVFVTVNEKNMTLLKRIKTVKQYRGICCLDDTTSGKPVIIVSCCASNNQSVDVLSLDGEILQSHRHDNRQPGRTLFTWPLITSL